MSVFHNAFGQRALVKYMRILTFHSLSVWPLLSLPAGESHWRRHTVRKPLHCQPSDWTSFKTRYCAVFTSMFVPRAPGYRETEREVVGTGDDCPSFSASILGGHFRLRRSPFFLQEAALAIQDDRWTVFAVLCGFQAWIHFNARTQGSRTRGRTDPHGPQSGVTLCCRTVAVEPTVLCCRKKQTSQLPFVRCPVRILSDLFGEWNGTHLTGVTRSKAQRSVKREALSIPKKYDSLRDQHNHWEISFW